MARMRILTLTTLYPNQAAPRHGVFVENRLRAFARASKADVRVIAPVPFFPFKASVFGGYSAFARAPLSEERHGITVRHPRYFIPPKIGMTYAAASLERCFLKAARALIDEGWDFDLIDAHYFYPDGVAAARIAEKLGKPVVITARGTDINLIPRYSRQRQMILEAARKADASIAVAEALKDEMVRLGATGEKITVLRNGVDLEAFRPLDREAIRARMGLTGPVIASVGHLIERKGHDLVIEALSKIQDASLLVAGEGGARRALEARAAALGLGTRVRFLGAVGHDQLAEIYNAADLLALASSREGWPNVLLEAMACGTPCVAAPVWGSGEVIRAPAAGLLARERTAPAIADAMMAVLGNPPARAAVRAYAEGFSWDETAGRITALFERIVEQRRRTASINTRPVVLNKSAPPKLIVTVDTEEEFDWSDFNSDWRHVHAPDGVNRFQSLCEEAGARPLYFITYPLLKDGPNVAYFRALRARRAADTGVHLHAWATAPYDRHRGAFYSYQTNLPDAVHRQKLFMLADQHEIAFGERARAHRAGRYGLGVKDYPLLRAAGIDFDFSPSAAFDFSGSGGPNETLRSNHPFTVECGDGGEVFVTPVCGAPALRHTRYFLSQERAAANPARRWTAPARLSPEGAGLEDLKALATRLIKDGVPVLTYSLHSSSMTPGANAYAPGPEAVSRILDTTRRFFRWFAEKRGGEFVSLDDLQNAYGPSTPPIKLNHKLSRVA